jgi:hypothetical protein
MLLRIAVRQVLDQLLSEEDRTMVALYYEIEDPKDYEGPWPPTFASVGHYIGTRFGSGPLAESTIRYRLKLVLNRWRELGVFRH